MVANAGAAQNGDVFARATIGGEWHIVAEPFLASDIHCVYGLEGGVDIGVVHHAHHHAGSVVSVVGVFDVLGPEGELQSVEG